MPVSSSLRLLVVLLSVCTVSCSEHKRLALEIEKNRKEYADYQEQLSSIQSKQGEISRAMAAMKNEPAVRRGIPNLDLQVNSLDSEVHKLTLQRDALKTYLEETKKDLAKYQSTNL